jgi:uncharacterized protein YkwD
MAKYGYVSHKEPGLSDNLLKRAKHSGYDADSVRENVYGPDITRPAIDYAMLTPDESVRQ